MSDRPDLPPALHDALLAPPLERKGWQTTIGPGYIGLFLWVVYFDRIAGRTLAVGGLVWSVVGAAVAGLLCYRLLYYAPAMWGFRTGRPLAVLASSTFGARGSTWMTGVLLGLAHVVWFAVAIDYAVDWTFQGFVTCRLLDPRLLRPIDVGGIRLESPPFLVTALAWSVAVALTGHYLMRIIAALMSVVSVIPAALLGLAVVLTLRGLPDFRPPGIDPASSVPVRSGGPMAVALMVQMVFGFFATAGVRAADWGTVAREPRDVKLGGWVGVAFASWVVATLALLTVAGALGRTAPAPAVAGPTGRAPAIAGPGRAPGPGPVGPSAPGRRIAGRQSVTPAPAPVPGNFSFREALLRGIGGNLAGAMFLVFGLASLAPGVFAAHVYGHRFTATWPQLSRIRWTLLGTTAAYTLIATGVGLRLEGIFNLMGAAIAPMAGAIAGDYAANRGDWPGPRRGVNPAGLIAWVVGLAVGLVPLIARARGWSALERFQPASVFAFLAALGVFAALARIGVQTPTVPVPERAASS